LKATERAALGLILVHATTAVILLSKPPTHVVEIFAQAASWLFSTALGAFLFISALVGTKHESAAANETGK
jgi:hypothetical protein